MCHSFAPGLVWFHICLSLPFWCWLQSHCCCWVLESAGLVDYFSLLLLQLLGHLSKTSSSSVFRPSYCPAPQSSRLPETFCVLSVELRQSSHFFSSVVNTCLDWSPVLWNLEFVFWTRPLIYFPENAFVLIINCFKTSPDGLPALSPV